ncbi:MAG TPA: hypothetical protein VF911_15780, partial [Thermoanaerobaculia bacterium]
MNLGIESFTYADLSSHERLKELALTFDRVVQEHDAELFAKFDLYRHNVQSGAPNGGLTAPEESALLIAVGRELGQFLTQLFKIHPHVAEQQARARRDLEVARFKREFVSKRVAKIREPRGGNDAAAAALGRAITNETDEELALAITANRLVELEKEYPRGAKEYAPTVETQQALAQLRASLDASLFRDVASAADADATASAAALHALTDLLADYTAAQWRAGRFDGWTS